MTAIGLDVGTGFVKCVSDTKKIKFPSLCAYRQHAIWESKKGKIEAVGDEAVKLAEYPDAVVIRPVMLGRPVHEKGFEELVKKAVDLVLQNNDAIGQESELTRFCMVIGLPYEARSHATNIQKMVTRLFHPKRCDVVPQVLGTLIDVDLSSAIVTSIGQGTTEIVAFKDYSAIRGISIHHAVNDISSKLGTSKTAYLDNNIFTNPQVNPLVAMLADSILDDPQWDAPRLAAITNSCIRRRHNDSWSKRGNRNKTVTGYYNTTRSGHVKRVGSIQTCISGMLTKSERRFIHDPNSISKSYKVVLKSRINKKIRRCGYDLKLITEKNSELQLNLGVFAELFDRVEPLRNSVISTKKNHTDAKSPKMSILDMNKMA